MKVTAESIAALDDSVWSATHRPESAYGRPQEWRSPYGGRRRTLVCRMSLGHADPHAALDARVTDREPVVASTRFLD